MLDDTRNKKSPNMEGYSVDNNRYSGICFFFHSLAGFRRFPGVVPLSIAFVDANNVFNVLNFVFRGPVLEASFFFFAP